MADASLFSALIGPIADKQAQIKGNLALGGSLLSSLGASYLSSREIAKAREEENRRYQDARSYYTTQYYRDPLSAIGNRSLLKSMDERMKDSAEALNNRAIASGATMENMLAARQADNRVMSDLHAQLIRGEDARRDAVAAQQQQLEDRHSAAMQSGFLQNARDWQSWGSALGDALMGWGAASLLDKKNG